MFDENILGIVVNSFFVKCFFTVINYFLLSLYMEFNYITMAINIVIFYSTNTCVLILNII